MAPTAFLRIEGDGLLRFSNVLSALSEGEVQVIAKRALNHTGGKGRTQVKRMLAKQTGLKQKRVVRALKVSKATGGNPKAGGFGGRLEYVITGTGGDIPLKEFSPVEGDGGVVAKPWNTRTVYAGAFLRGGRWPDGRSGFVAGGHVMHRVGASRKPLALSKSGVVIPNEMVKGATAQAFQKMGPVLSERLSHEAARSRKLQDLTGGTSF
ncbi:hypothetical protein E3C22_18130 [Jiella endophytica]|uniref:Minor tail protein n=1 Tax=Jiella endophytica TaxID=2558362 RepID=A0A4Y8RER4_9HYPH|nr:hypothetical protein [Jiella endophytica]TFF20806.1 hypothetical protein E3C22_18130 [Jiella endophytica]